MRNSIEEELEREREGGREGGRERLAKGGVREVEKKKAVVFRGKWEGC